MPTLFWRFALLFLAQINIPIRHFFFFSQKQCIKVKHKHHRTTIVRNNFDVTFSVEKFSVFYGAELGVVSPPSSARIKVLQKCNYLVPLYAGFPATAFLYKTAIVSCLSRC